MSFKLEIDKVIADIAALDRTEADSAAVADVAAHRLFRLLPHVGRLHSLYRPARAGEELMYAIASEPITGISMYLVSNGPGNVVPPHEHLTWSAVVGLSGIEDNRIYRQVDGSSRVVYEIGKNIISQGETLALGCNAIHSTSVVGCEPTYQLHLYGKPLASLPALRSRSFMVQRAA